MKMELNDVIVNQPVVIDNVSTSQIPKKRLFLVFPLAHLLFPQKSFCLRLLKH